MAICYCPTLMMHIGITTTCVHVSFLAWSLKLDVRRLLVPSMKAGLKF